MRAYAIMFHPYAWLAGHTVFVAIGAAKRATGEISFTTLAIVMGLAVAAPLLVNLRPSLRLPSAVAEIVLGIAVAHRGWDGSTSTSRP